MLKPQLSLVISTLDRIDSVDRLLRSLFLQNFDLKKLEVVVAMGAKNPAQEARLKKWRGHLNIRGVSAPEGGIAGARNRGAESARADVILLLDDDMELRQKDILRTHLEAHADPDLAALGGAWDLPADAPLPAVADRLLALSRMERSRRKGETTSFLFSRHASYKRRIFEGGARFDEALESGSSEAEFHLKLDRGGETLKSSTRIRPIRHHEVALRDLLRDSFLHGHDEASLRPTKRKPAPKPRLAKTIPWEDPGPWRRPLLSLYCEASLWSEEQGRLEALQEEPSWKTRLARWLGRLPLFGIQQPSH